MPWQDQVAMVGGELLPGTRIPAYREVVVTVPRQNGKTTLTLAWEVQRGVGWGSPQRIAYTAQTGKDAREKLLNDQFPLLDPTKPPKLPVKALVSRCLAGVGNEGVLFKTGSRIILLNSGEDSGHGKTIDLGVIDEAFADEDDRREQAMLPAMLTRAEAQVFIISTAGTERSPFLRRKVDHGRACVEAGITQGTAYFEWSADENADPDDEATWWSCMPALGRKVTIEAVRHARQTMTDGDFRRACLNLWTVSDERVIPAAIWNAVCADDVAPAGELTLAVEIDVERSIVSVAVADDQGRVELVEEVPERHELAEKLAELAVELDAEVVVDKRGPAASLIPEMEQRFVRHHPADVDEIANWCGSFYDRVADRRIAIRRSALLDVAVAGATKRTVGDRWVWGRRAGRSDVSPLVAATLAAGRARDVATRAAPWAAT